MNYELAKRLKSAGFKFTKTQAEVSREPMTVGRERVFLPTLSELIEACGRKNFSLSCNEARISEARWTAADHVIEELADSIAFGATPEEAVANLWLAINPKK